MCDAYQQLPNGNTYFKATGLDSRDFIELEFARVPHSSLHHYPLELYSNITNQPTFANASSCDNMIRLFNTSMSTGEHAPVSVHGRAIGRAFPFNETTHKWADIHGIQVATPFIENNYLDCQTMRGYSGIVG